MNQKEAAKKALVVDGNHARFKKLMKRAAAGEDLHIGFLGGSITQGSLASQPQNCYAQRVFQWWEQTFPKSRFSFINAGIGGTTSLFGASRAWMDIMRYRPDFVVIDFTVNDDATEFFQETFEGVVRQVYGDPAAPAVMILNNVFYDDGRNAQDLHNVIARHYGIPSVSMRESLYQMICGGEVNAADVTPDNLHPNDRGHAIVADMLITQLETIYRDLDAPEEEPAYPCALTANRFEPANRYQITNCRPVCAGFLPDPREKTALLDLYKNGWSGARVGDSITFELECSHISAQFLRAVDRNRPLAQAIVDGDEEHAVLLDGNFDEDWGDCLALHTVFESGQKKRHTLEIRICEAAEGVKPFYLVSVITD